MNKMLYEKIKIMYFETKFQVSRNLSVKNDCEKSFSVFTNQKVTELLK